MNLNPFSSAKPPPAQPQTVSDKVPWTYRWFAPGDFNACFALTLDNMMTLTVFANILTGVFGFPAQVIYVYMIPGTALGVCVGDLVYTWMAVRLAQKERRSDVTAMPLGLDTPSTIGMALAILGPAFLAIKTDLLQQGIADVEAVQRAAFSSWAIGMAMMLMIGAMKVAFSFAGEWIRSRIPQAGLLGSIGGIGLVLLSFYPLLEVFKAPIIGMVCLGLILCTLIARIELPWRIPGAIVAALVGTVLYYGILGPLNLLGSIAFHVPSLHTTLSPPWPTLEGFRALKDALPYLPIAIPFSLLTIVGGINVTESARAAGDPYDTKGILLTEAAATVLAGLCGGVAQSTPFIGHPAYKQLGARAGYTLITGLAVGIGGLLGYVSFAVSILPLAAVTPVLIFVGFEISAQAFYTCPKRYAPAIAISFLPIIANLLLIRQDTLLGNLQGAVASVSAQLGEHAVLVENLIRKAAEQIDAHILVGLGHGFILTAMLWGSFCALIIDRKLRQAALFIAISGLLTLFGLIHSIAPNSDLYWPWQKDLSPMVLHWACGYFALAALVWGLSFTRSAQEPVPADMLAE